MSDIRGVGPAGTPLDVSVTKEGDLYTALRAYSTGRLSIPGIGTAAAYASGDAFGGVVTVPVPSVGTIATVLFFDYDKEGLPKELVLFARNFTPTADNGAFDPSDADLTYCVGVVSDFTFYSYNSNQIGIALPALYYVAQLGLLYGQWVTRGADNIAAGAIPQFSLVVV